MPVGRSGACGGMLDSRRVETLRFRFPDRGREDLVLGPGVHAVGHGPDGPRLVGRGSEARIQVSIDGRGSWLQLREGGSRVHVNGRPVRRMALLRAGDSVHIDGVELGLVGAEPRALPETPAAPPAPSRQVLRGIGGIHHGRSFTLDHPRTLGSAADSDIRLDEPGVADRHLELQPHAEGVALRCLDAQARCLVNGHPVSAALLGAGDQLVAGNGQRFLIESPLARVPEARLVAPEYPAEVFESVAPGNGPVPAGNSWRHLPWVLVAAVVIAGLLALLLTSGG